MAITERLAHLASLDIQRRFIIYATRDEYLLPEELLEDASAVVQQIRMQPQTISALAPQQV